MNSQLKAKLLQQLAKNKKKNKGFTLIELLVVVIIVGILAAVALPNLLGQVGKARETEGKNGIGTINRAQQAYHFEKQTFNQGADTTAEDNPLGVVVTSDYYTFAIPTGDGTTSLQNATATDATDNGTRTYAGSVGYAAGQYNSIVCQTDDIPADNAPPSVTTGADPTCAEGTSLQ